MGERKKMTAFDMECMVVESSRFVSACTIPNEHEEPREREFNWDFLFVVISIVGCFIAFRSYTDIHWFCAWVFFFFLSLHLSFNSSFVHGAYVCSFAHSLL